MIIIIIICVWKIFLCCCFHIVKNVKFWIYKLYKEGEKSFFFPNNQFNMDSRIGLDYIVENAEYTTKLGAGKTLKN